MRRCAIVLLLGLAAVAHAQGDTPADPKAGKLSVTGSATVTVTPDVGKVDFTIQATQPSVAEACDDVARAASAVQAAVDAAVPDAVVATVGISVSQNITYSDAGQKFNGYLCSNAVNVKITNANATELGQQVSAAVDAAIKAGGNLLQVGNMVTELSPELQSEATNQARELAVDNGKTIAKTLSKAAGVTLGPIKSVSDSNLSPPTPMPMAESAAPMVADAGAAAKATPVVIGEQQVSATVALEYAFTNA